jgi:hypothetical protein
MDIPRGDSRGVVIDKSGKRIAYGTGPVTSGNIDITGTGN